MGNKLVVTPDKGVRRVMQNVVGTLLFGPARLLGLPAGIWSQQVVTEDADNELVALKTNFIANRIRRKAQTLYYFLSVPLWIAALWLVFDKLPQIVPAGLWRQIAPFLWQNLLRLFVHQ